VPYYTYKPQSVLETKSYKLYYDRHIITDRVVETNRPVLWNKENRNVFIIDVAVSSTFNMMETIAEKQRKYCELQQEIKRTW